MKFDRIGCALALSLFASIPAHSQSLPPPPPSPGDLPPTPGDGSPAIRYLMATYNIPETEARLRITLQEDVAALARTVRAEGDSAFGGIWIEHEPVFKIVVGFSDQKDRKALRDQISPKLRRYVQIKNVARSEAVISGQLDTLVAAIRSSGIQFTSGFSNRNEKFFVAVETNQSAQLVRSLIPAQLKGDVELRVEPLPKAQQVSGVRAGDEIQAGFDHYQNNNPVTQGCTYAYAVRYGAQRLPGVLTAAHCPGAFLWRGHWINLGPAVTSQNAANTKYDYKIHSTAGLTQGPWVWFRNIQSIPEFPSQGYYGVTGQLGYQGQKVGMVMCKSGQVTGITCGEITHGWYTFNGAKGWIEVSNTRQADLSAGGDSGGPWFMYPGTSSGVTAVGIHTAGTGNCAGRSCKAVYMPIDYISDHIPVTLVTTANP